MPVSIFPIIFFMLVALRGFAQEDIWYLPASGVTKLSTSWVVSDQHFDNEGKRQDNIVQYGYYSTAHYGESFWSKRFFTVLYFPFLNYVYTELPPATEKNAKWRVGDINLGLSYLFLNNDKTTLTGSLHFGIPIRPHEFVALKSGDNIFSQLIQFEVSRKISDSPASGILSFYGGYKNRTYDYAEEFHFGGSGSVMVSGNKLKLALYLDGIEALGSSDNALYINPTSIFSNFKEYIRLTPEVTYQFNSKWGLSISTGIHIAGRNYVANSMYTIGITRNSIDNETMRQ